MSSILKGIQRIVLEEVSSVIYQLSQKYDFNFDQEYDAFLANFALSNKTQKIKQPKPLKEKPLKDNDKSPKWKLPFNGTISHSLCHAICRADGLYIQCKKTPFAESDLCKTCQNYMLKNDKLPYGRIEERAEVGLYEFRFGKYAPLHYSLYMKKHNLSRETVEEYTASIGITLDEQHFAEVEEPPKKKGGRKPKSAIQVVNATNDNVIDDVMQDIFGASNSDADDDSDSDDSDSDSDDSDDGLQFSKKSNKTPVLAKKPEVKQPEPAKKPPVLAKEPVLAKKHEVNAKESKKPEAKQPEPVVAKKPEVKTKKPEPKQPEPVLAKKHEVKTKESKKPELPEPVLAKKHEVKTKEHIPIISSGKHGEIWTLPEPELEPETIPEPQKVTVKKFTYAGVKYLRNPIDNSIFDLNHKLIGSFNPDTMCLELFDQDEEEEEEEDDEEDDDEDDE